MPKEITKCNECGAKTVKYRHRINEPLALALFRWYEKGKPWHYEKLGLTHKQQCNYSKLRHWGLLEKSSDEKGERMGGYWCVTERGRQWIRGQIRIQAWVITYRNRFDRFEGEEISFRDYHPYEWREKPDYVRDQEPFGRGAQGELF